MAEANDAEAEAPAPKKKSKLIIIVVAAVVLLVAAGAGAFLLFKNSKSADDAEADAEGDVVEVKRDKKSDAPPVYVKLEMFTTNLAMENPGEQQAAQYIQIVVELKVDEAPDGELLKQYMPEIRNGILRLLSSKKPSDLTSTQGKDTLAEEIRNAVNGITNPSAKKNVKAKGPVAAVLFSSFIIQ
ncbi:MAG: flagellar basal body-associated FliL family protein [Rhodocyclaceae bacterium]|jgi:flagellar FliL protein|nr:flagellar basal body-associated FliL family protein [Rhodocyclaceae bacterium]